MQTGWYKLPVTTENTAASDNTQAEDSAETATASPGNCRRSGR